jgi:hypothetical protein
VSEDRSTDGGPAFPNAGTNMFGPSPHPGMTLRDYAAVHVLAALYAGPARNMSADAETSAWAIEEAIGIADRLLRELGKGSIRGSRDI